MRISLIPPIENLDYVKRGQSAMILAHLVSKYSEYTKFYRKLKMFKTIDNGIYEGDQRSIGEVLDAAEAVGADEVILPDVIFDSKATIESAENALEYIRKKRLVRRFKYMVAIQGKTPKDWWNCFHYFNRHDYIQTIGFSKLSCPVAFGKEITQARLQITSEIEKSGNVSNRKEYHLLGGSYQILTELMCQPSWIRSIDTSAPFEYGKSFKKLDTVRAEPKKKADLLVPIEPQHEEFVEHNLSLLFNRNL